MSNIVNQFVYSPLGLVTLAGVGMMLGVFYAYKKVKDSDIKKADKEKDMFKTYYEALKKHGNNSNRLMIKDGTVVGYVKKELKKKQNRYSKAILKYIGKDEDSEQELEENGVCKFLVCRNKKLHKILSKIPIIKRKFSDIYLVSENNIDRAINSIVLKNSVAFDKVVGVWADMTASSISDIYNVHGLDLLRQNMEQNKNFAKRMMALDPETAKQQILIEEGYRQKSNYYQNKKNQRHG